MVRDVLHNPRVPEEGLEGGVERLDGDRAGERQIWPR
jgi:hypothetical protein